LSLQEKHPLEKLDALRTSLPDAARDIRLNLENVLKPATLETAQVYGVAVACAYAARTPKLTEALIAAAKSHDVPDGVIEDAKAAAILMAMNNVYYRFRHISGKEAYSQKPARLRMQRINQVTSNKADFELFCLAVSAINNCETCVRSHEATVLGHGMTEDHVHDAVRIAATVHAAAVGLETLDV